MRTAIACAPLLTAIAAAACASNAPAYRAFDDVPYGYANERSFWSERAQTRVRIAELGTSGPAAPLVLIHPWGTSMLVWKDVAPQLAESRRVILVDLPGHGKSGKAFGSYPIRRLAGAVIDALDEAKIPRAIIAGNSLGGATSIEVALRAPGRVLGLILIGAPGGKTIPEPLRQMVARASGPRALMTLNDEAFAIGWWAIAPNMTPLAVRLRDDGLALRRTSELGAWARATSSALREVTAYAPDCEKIGVPALIVHGSDDLVVTDEYAEALAQRIKRAKLARIEGCGHMPEVECPARLLEVLAPFLASAELGP